MHDNRGKLSMVATPIGNLGDLSPRAKETLLAADMIVAEDTCSLRSLITDGPLTAELVRGDDANEEKAAQKVIAALDAGKKVAVVTDAGTPGISDPGYLLVKKVREHFGERNGDGADGFDGENVTIEAIPGPSALAAAISISGIPATPFTFFGFPPAKKGRAGFFQNIASLGHTAVMYESPHRFMKTLAELQAAMKGEERIIFVGRELTKMHEEGKCGTLSEIISHYEAHPDKVRGEFVIIVQE